MVPRHPQTLPTQVTTVARFSPVLGIALLFLASGCGGPAKPDYPTATLEGVVSIDGEVVQSGSLQFSPGKDVKGNVTQAQIVDGKFIAKDVPVGQVRVTFAITKQTGKMITEYSTPYPEVVSLVPAHYKDGIEYTAADDHNVRFELTSKPKPKK